MYVPRWELAGFDVLKAEDKCPLILAMVRALIEIDRREIRSINKGAELYGSDPVDPLYQSGVRYFPQKEQDDWKDTIQVLASGGGSCNSLSAWRVAELLEAGKSAGPYIQTQIQRHRRGLVHVFHVIVWTGDPNHPTFECPSRTLGMKDTPYDD
jgi:hypothetical protein